jgi:hypothetical protein
MMAMGIIGFICILFAAGSLAYLVYNTQMNKLSFPSSPASAQVVPAKPNKPLFPVGGARTSPAGGMAGVGSPRPMGMGSSGGPPAGSSGGATQAPRLTAAHLAGLKASPTLTAVWAVTDTCPACRQMASTLDQMQAEGMLTGLPIGGMLYKNEWTPEIAPDYIPTVYTVGRGQIVKGSSGALKPDGVVAHLRTLMQ